MAKPKVHLGQLLLRAFYWMDEGLQYGLQVKGWPEVTHAQSMLIITVSEGVTRPSAIARQLGISRQAVHQSLNEMVKLGVLELVQDPDDGRAKRVQIPKLVLPIVQEARKISTSLEKKLVKRLGGDSLNEMRKILEKDWKAPF